jgi:peptidoglycan hydrolase-like protein with peptidoglycan-binding domain
MEIRRWVGIETVDKMTDSLAFIEIMLAQSALQQSGHYHGPVDGKLSKSARQALMGFQKDDGLEVTGELDDELFSKLMALRQSGRMPLTVSLSKSRASANSE